MNAGFSGMRVLVTGATRGIGAATARRFLEAGADVLEHGRSRANAEEAVRSLAREFGDRAAPVWGDLARRGDIEHIAKSAGELDVLVNSAGIYEERAIPDADEAHWDRILAVNLDAPWLLSRALMDGLSRRRGIIVNVSSESGLLGYAGSSVYCASKGALIGLTRAIAVELAPDVRAVCVCPGPVDTDMLRDNAAPGEWESFPLLARAATPRDIAEAILFAASPRCSFQTGSIITVDGGTTAGKRT
jgi:NAD(P)-dependent dehydrogenase (short-subunit alcohol dehydrogenase family)